MPQSREPKKSLIVSLLKQDLKTNFEFDDDELDNLEPTQVMNLALNLRGQAGMPVNFQIKDGQLQWLADLKCGEDQ